VNASTFSVTSSFRPRTISGLKPIQKKQLRVAGRGHDGKNLPAEARLAPRVDPNAMDPNESFDGYLEIVGVSDEHNKLVYDVFICTPDSGSVFKAGTTRVVAELIQGGIQCRNAVLSERLRRALAARRKPTAKRR
jgi:hypothetical protein